VVALAGEDVTRDITAPTIQDTTAGAAAAVAITVAAAGVAASVTGAEAVADAAAGVGGVAGADGVATAMAVTATAAMAVTAGKTAASEGHAARFFIHQRLTVITLKPTIIATTMVRTATVASSWNCQSPNGSAVAPQDSNGIHRTAN
jgi:hypothetical protein